MTPERDAVTERSTADVAADLMLCVEVLSNLGYADDPHTARIEALAAALLASPGDDAAAEVIANAIWPYKRQDECAADIIAALRAAGAVILWPSEGERDG